MKISKAKKVKIINKKTMIVTLDIGKTTHYGYFRSPNGEDIQPFPFKNCRDDFDMFWNKLCQFKKAKILQEVVVGFESSGPYAEPLFHYLRDKPVSLVQINPFHSKRLKELTGNSPNKTDKKDPRVIADVISLGHALTLVVPEGPKAELRRLTQARERALKRRTVALNQLQSLVFLVFPEFLTIMKGMRTKTAFYLISKYPAPESIVTLGVGSLEKIMRNISHGKLGRQRAGDLFNSSKKSIGIREGRESIFLEIDYLLSQIGEHNTFMDNLEKQMEHCLNEIPYSQSLLSIRGLGRITVAGLIGEVGDFNKFHTISEIMKLAGLDLFEISSGRQKGRRRISKRGRPLLRKLLYFAAINVVKPNMILHKHYQQMLSRGMVKVKALIAIARKLLRIVFALARDNTVYIDNYIHNRHIKLAA